MLDKKIYIFQNWKFGTNSLEEFNEWDTEINITEEIKKLLSTLNVDEDSIVVNIKKFKEKIEKEKQPIYKYKCSCEDGREIKSKCEYLNIHCNDCDEDFKIIDNDK